MDSAGLDVPELLEPSTQAEWDSYFDLRWRVLRAPWKQPRGSERDESDATSYHLMARGADGLALAVGRLHAHSAELYQVRYMAVDPDWRGQALGGRLLEGLEARARSLGAAEIFLNARQEAIPFYLKHGYILERPTETLFGEVRHTQMRKRL